MPAAYNLWKGFACTARPGDCSLYLAHLRDNVCRGDEVLHHYLMGWMARAVQQPDTPGEVAVVLRGGRGVGKSLFAREFGKLFGRHYLQVSNPSHLVGNFNAHLRDVVVLFADEAFYAGDKKHASILKTLITEETITIEAKGVDVETSPNYVHLIMASNDEHVVPAGGDERRFLVLDVGNEHQQDTAYFRAVVAQMNEGGREALLHTLLTWNLEGFNVRSVPRTAALEEQKVLSLDPMQDWWYEKLRDGRLLQRGEGWPVDVMKDQLVDDYVRHTQRFNVSRRGNATALGMFLGKVCPGLNQIQRLAEVEELLPDGFTRRVERRCYFWILPSLERARERWAQMYGTTDWPAVMQDEQPALPNGRTPF